MWRLCVASVGLVAYGYGGADGCPGVEPLCVEHSHVDAAVAHRLAKVVVPVGTVNSICAVKIGYKLHVGQTVTGPAHGLGPHLAIDRKLADRGGCASLPARDERAKDWTSVFIGRERLL